MKSPLIAVKNDRRRPIHSRKVLASPRATPWPNTSVWATVELRLGVSTSSDLRRPGRGVGQQRHGVLQVARGERENERDGLGERRKRKKGREKKRKMREKTTTAWDDGSLEKKTGSKTVGHKGERERREREMVGHLATICWGLGHLNVFSDSKKCPLNFLKFRFNPYSNFQKL